MRATAGMLALVALVAAGCASVPAGAPTPSSATPESFDLAGRFSARRGDEAVAGRFDWRRANGRDAIVFSAPTGQALAQMEGDASGVRLTLPDGRVDEAPDWEALTAKALGVPIPVRGLAYWLLARPRPAAPHDEERDRDGRMTLLRQDGWEIVYGWASGDRPARLRMTYPDVELRIALESPGG